MQTSIIIDGRECNAYIQDEDAAFVPDMDREDWRDLATERADNDIDALYIFPLANGRQLEVYVEQGYPNPATTNERRSIPEILADFEDGCETQAERLSCWGFDGLNVLTPVSEGFDGECCIWRAPSYYAGTCNAPGDDFVRNGDGLEPEAIADPNGRLIFPSYAAAAEYVRDYYNAPSGYDGIPACSVLSHGQAGPDTLTIVAAD